MKRQSTSHSQISFCVLISGKRRQSSATRAASTGVTADAHKKSLKATWNDCCLCVLMKN